GGGALPGGAAASGGGLATGDVRVNDAVAALVALGFKPADALTAARASVAMLGPTAPVEQIVRACLKRPA
ncbi:MAG: RuvA, C-terminal domain, partial [Verrucomicrobiota bacterium]